jgi:hypothetical protein
VQPNRSSAMGAVSPDDALIFVKVTYQSDTNLSSLFCLILLPIEVNGVAVHKQEVSRVAVCEFAR